MKWRLGGHLPLVQLNGFVLARLYAGAAIYALIRIEDYRLLSFQRSCGARFYTAIAFCSATAAGAFTVLPAAFLIIYNYHLLPLSINLN